MWERIKWRIANKFFAKHVSVFREYKAITVYRMFKDRTQSEEFKQFLFNTTNSFLLKKDYEGYRVMAEVLDVFMRLEEQTKVKNL